MSVLLRASVLAVVVASAGACFYKPWHVPRDRAIVLQPSEGLVALAVDTKQIVSLVVCLDGDLAQCSEVGPVTSTDGVVVARMTAGRQCIMQLAFESGATGHVVTAQKHDARCIYVERGHIAYPGHLVLDTAAVGNTAVSVWRARWDDRRGVIQTLVSESYPHLAALPLTTVALDAASLPDD